MSRSPPMDSHFPATKEDLHYVQMDVKHVQAVQINHADRLLRLERRQADDAALKSVWGSGSPFPGVLSGTPIQGPIQNPSNDVFDDFDDEQGQTLLGSLQLETDDEPVRRGASRANSVRFDVSALQGSNWAQGSRNSGEFGPIRPSSGIGSHPMTERSLSHKSDGRHSSAGYSAHSVHSVPSGRTSSLGLDTNFIIGGQDDDDSPIEIPDPPPGLFILGSVPSIIRCWLTTNFLHSSLLYGAVCTGSQRSVLDYSLVKELGLVEQIQKHREGHNTIRLPVYLPEAVITQPSSRSNSPAPQLPTLTPEFEIVGLNQRVNSDRKFGIRVFIGSDTLRLYHADILFSQNLMTLYGDGRNKLSVPFVRPEDDAMFKNLCTGNIPPEKIELKANATSLAPTESKTAVVPSSAAISPRLESQDDQENISKLHDMTQRPASSGDQQLSHASINTTAAFARLDQAMEPRQGPHMLDNNISDSEKQLNIAAVANELANGVAPADSTRRESSGGIWGSWRQGTASNASDNSDSASGYQRATKVGRNMKVLKPSKSISATSVPSRASSARVGPTYEPAPSRPSGETRRKSQAGGTDNIPRWEAKRTASDGQKGPRTITTASRSSNPVGGASAFAWMNTSKQKASAASAE